MEVVSPSESSREVEEKVTEWLEAGCGVVVVLDPVRKIATVHRPGAEVRSLDAADHLSIPDLLPGWAVPLAELFR